MSDYENKATGGKTNRAPGEYVGTVENLIGDPAGSLLRVQVRVHGVFTDGVPVADLPWAELDLALGAGANCGTFRPLKVGQTVWVRFRNADTRWPIVVRSAHYAPGGVPNLPHEAFAGPLVHTHQRVGAEPAQPAHGYHEDEVSTVNGCTIERNIDGSVSIYQRSSGSEVCISANGDIVIHGENNLHFSSKADTLGVVAGDMSITVGGNATLAVEGSVEVTAGTTAKVQAGSSAEVIAGTTAKVQAATSATIQAPQINLVGAITSTGSGGGAGTVTLNGALQVNGSIAATGNITDGGANTNHHSHP